MDLSNTRTLKDNILETLRDSNNLPTQSTDVYQRISTIPITPSQVPPQVTSVSPNVHNPHDPSHPLPFPDRTLIYHSQVILPTPYSPNPTLSLKLFLRLH